MKKLSVILVMVFSLSFANALTFNDCHAAGCEEVEAWENEFGELSEEMIDAVYEIGKEECEDDQ